MPYFTAETEKDYGRTDEEIEASAGREISIPGTLYGVTILVKGE